MNPDHVSSIIKIMDKTVWLKVAEGLNKIHAAILDWSVFPPTTID